jgi:hypothetical protein
MARCLLRLLHEHPQHDHSFARRCHIKRPSNAVGALHANFPKRPFDVIDVRLAHVLQTEFRNQFHGVEEARLNVVRQSREFGIDGGVEGFNGPGFHL